MSRLRLGPSMGARIVSGLLIALFAAIVLSVIVNILSNIWPWLVIIGLVGVGLSTAVVRYRSRDSHW